MAEIGVRELKVRASEIVHAIREQRERYVITYRGRPVAVLLPMDEAQAPGMLLPPEVGDAWDELTRLGEEIGREWQSPLTSVEILSGMRR